MKVHIASKNPTLRASLKKHLHDAGLHDFTSLDITDKPIVQGSDLVLLDFEYFSSVPLTEIFQFTEALRAKDVRLLFLVKPVDRKIFDSMALSLNYPNSGKLELPLTLRRLKAALDQE
jgi:hypothetical protein